MCRMQSASIIAIVPQASADCEDRFVFMGLGQPQANDRLGLSLKALDLCAQKDCTHGVRDKKNTCDGGLHP